MSDWQLNGNIIIAWVLTVPVSGLTSFGVYRLLTLLFSEG